MKFNAWEERPGPPQRVGLYLQEAKHSYRELFFKIFYLFIFRERGREGERKGEKHQCVVVSHMPPTGELACNPGMCPDWEWSQEPLHSQSDAQITEPHPPGLVFSIR